MTTDEARENPQENPQEKAREKPVEWYVVPEGSERLGPMPVEEVRDLIRRRKVWPVSLCWHSGMDEWRPMGEAVEFRDLFVEVSREPPPAGEPGAGPTADDSDPVKRGWDVVRGMFRRGKDEVVRTKRTAELLLKLRSLRGERDDVLARIGRGVHDEGAAFLENAAHEPLFQEVERLDEEIAAAEAELAALKRSVTDDGGV